MSSYVNIFDTMIFVLSQFVHSEKALNTKEIQYRLGMSLRSTQRITKDLAESGWLDVKTIGRDKLYSASDKAKKLFTVAV